MDIFWYIFTVPIISYILNFCKGTKSRKFPNTLINLHKMPAARLPIKALLSVIKKHSALIDGSNIKKHKEIYALYLRFYHMMKQTKFWHKIQTGKTKVLKDPLTGKWEMDPLTAKWGTGVLSENRSLCPLIRSYFYNEKKHEKIRIELACNRDYTTICEHDQGLIHYACLELTWHTLHMEFWTEKIEQCAKRFKRIPTHLRLLCQNNHSLAISNDGTFGWSSQVIVVQRGLVAFFPVLTHNDICCRSTENTVANLTNFWTKPLLFLIPMARGFHA